MGHDKEPYSNPENQALWGIPTPDWRSWSKRRSARLWQAAALICNVSPESLEFQPGSGILDTVIRRIPPCVTSLIARASSALGEGFLKSAKQDFEHPENSEVDLTAFTTWANFIGWPLPEGLPWSPELNLAVTGWPWGRHETELLRKLAAAADRFWKNYDPSDSTTAPTNEEVAKWLKSQGVAARTAEIMATILRPDDLPRGPRK